MQKVVNNDRAVEALKVLSLLIQEKDSQNDTVAVGVLIWAHDRLIDALGPF